MKMFNPSPWSKWALIAGLVLVLGFILGATTLLYFIAKFQNDSADPAYVMRVAHSLAEMDQSLPAAFRYGSAFEFLGSQMITLTHSPDGLSLILGSVPISKNYESADEIMDSLLKVGVLGFVPSQSSSHRSPQVERGSEFVAGKKLTYLLGSSVDRTGKKSQAFIGIFPVNQAGKAVFVYGANKYSPEYNLAATREFLHHIKHI
jgi:hypothetical protein